MAWAKSDSCMCGVRLKACHEAGRGGGPLNKSTAELGEQQNMQARCAQHHDSWDHM